MANLTRNSTEWSGNIDINTKASTVNIPTSGKYVDKDINLTLNAKSGSATTPSNTTALDSTSTSLSSTTLTVQASVTPTVSEGWVASGTTGTVKIKGTVPTQTKTATPSASQQTISPDSGKLLSSVTVDAVSAATAQAICGNATITTSAGTDGMTTYFDNGSSSDKNVTITPKYTNTAGYKAATSTATNNGGTSYWKIKKAVSAAGTASSDATLYEGNTDTSINPNLILNTATAVTKTGSSTTCSSHAKSFDTQTISYANVKGKTFTFSYEYDTSGAFSPCTNAPSSYDAKGERCRPYISISHDGTTAWYTKDFTIHSKGKYSLTFTINSDWNVTNIQVSHEINGYPTAGQTWYVKNIKLEEGSIATPWIPNTHDTGITNIKEAVELSSSASNYYVPIKTTGTGNSKITTTGWIEAKDLETASATEVKYVNIPKATFTRSGGNINVATAGYIDSGTVGTVSASNLASGNIELQQQTGTSVVGKSTASVKTGSATTPTASGASTSTSLSGTTLTVARSVTPTVSAGWVSSGTAGTVTITGTVPTETKTVTPSTAQQTINPTSGKLISSITVNATSKDTAKSVVGDASFANSATSGVTYTDYTSSGPVLKSGDYLYINEGYTPARKISLAKLVPDGVVLGTGATSIADGMLNTFSAYDNDGALITGNIATKTDSGNVSLSASTTSKSYAAGYYPNAHGASISASSTGTSNSGTKVSTVSPTTSTQYVNITAGATAAKYWEISGVSEATAKSKLGNATVSANSPTITPTIASTVTSGTTNYAITGSASTSVSVGTAGYISSSDGTKNTGTASISGSVAQSQISTSDVTVPNGTTPTNIAKNTNIKISAGYYPTDRYYKTQNYSASDFASGNKELTARTGTSVVGYSTASAPSATPAFDGGGLSKGTASGGGLSGGGLTAGDGEVSVSKATVTVAMTPTMSDSSATSGYGITSTKPASGIYATFDPGASVTTNGIAKGRGSVTRAAVTRAAFSQPVTRAAVLYNGAVEGWVSKADNATALSADTTGVTVSLAADSTTIGSTSGTSNWSSDSNINPNITDGTTYYVPVSSVSASATNGTASITTQPSASASLTRTNNIGTTTKPSSGTAGTDYWAFTSSASANSGVVTATGGSASASVSKGLTAGANTGTKSGTTATTTAATASDSSSVYITKATITNGASLGTNSSSGTISRGTYIKFGAGYNPTDKYYYAQADAHSAWTPSSTYYSTTNSGFGAIDTSKYTPSSTYYIKAGAGAANSASLTANGYYSGDTISSTTDKIAMTTTATNGYYKVTASGSSKISTAGWLNTGALTAASQAYYIKKGVITNNTSGGTSTATINRGGQIKISSGYYPSDLYYTAEDLIWVTY